MFLGKTGQAIDLQTNYFKLLSAPDWGLYQYRIDFSPEEERNIVKKGLLRVHKDKIGAYVFDGTILYTSNRLQQVQIIKIIFLFENFSCESK